VWQTPAPSKMAFFTWSAALEKIFTLDNLRKRHVIMINRCYMFKKTEESVDHLFHCNVASTLWNTLFQSLSTYKGLFIFHVYGFYHFMFHIHKTQVLSPKFYQVIFYMNIFNVKDIPSFKNKSKKSNLD
jgi:hypothetical protein